VVTSRCCNVKISLSLSPISRALAKFTSIKEVRPYHSFENQAHFKPTNYTHSLGARLFGSKGLLGLLTSLAHFCISTASFDFKIPACSGILSDGSDVRRLQLYQPCIRPSLMGRGTVGRFVSRYGTTPCCTVELYWEMTMGDVPEPGLADYCYQNSRNPVQRRRSSKIVE
jgi:hypothetical protein